MEENPYSEIAGMLQAPDGVLIMRRGTVLKVTPLTIDVGGIKILGDELQVNSTVIEQMVSEPPRILKGDTLLLLTTDDQVFNVLCKVVNV